MKEIDARGLSCPEPVLLTKKALSSREDRYNVIVDNEVACENVTRYAKSQKYKVEVKDNNGEFILELNKE